MIDEPIFTATERQQLIERCFELDKQLQDAEDQTEQMRDQFLDLIRTYKAKVPIIPLSRCPYCQAINYHSLDYFDLDGLWWKRPFWGMGWRLAGELCCRPRQRHRLCPHFWTLSGALHFGQRLPSHPLVIYSGPEVPFVMTRLLEQHSMRAVISSLAVGDHTAYPIVYYSPTKPVVPEEFFKEWANYYAVLVQENGRIAFVEDASYQPWGSTYQSWPYDFELAPWIQRGHLFWIAPGDESLTLRQEPDGCPYLHLLGRRERLFIRDGQILTWNEYHSYLRSKQG
jgi:hypothetical protein